MLRLLEKLSHKTDFKPIPQQTLVEIYEDIERTAVEYAHDHKDS